MERFEGVGRGGLRDSRVPVFCESGVLKHVEAWELICTHDDFVKKFTNFPLVGNTWTGVDQGEFQIQCNLIARKTTTRP